MAGTINKFDTHVANYEIYVAGGRTLGSAEVTLPDLAYMTTTIKGAGVLGEIDVPTIGHFSNLETTIKWLAINEHNFKFIQHNRIDFAFYVAQQGYDSATGKYSIVQDKFEIGAVPKNLNLGKVVPAELMDTETVCSIVNIKETYNKKVVFELDKLNGICKINGVDCVSDLKTALGLI